MTSCSMDGYLAAYVLDALEPYETETLQAHLPTCDICRNELATLSWIPTVLPLVRLEDIEQLADEAAPRPRRLLAPPQRTRRYATAVAGAALFAGVSGLFAVGGAQHEAKPPTIHAVDPQTQVSAAVTVVGRSWGTEFELALDGVYPGGTCSLIARSDDGRNDTAATWVASQQGTANIPGATAIPASHLTELDVVAANGTPLVRIVMPHKGGAAARPN